MQDEFDKGLVALLADPPNEALRLELLPQSVGCQSVLGETEVEERGHVDFWGRKLFLLLDEIGATDEPNGALVAQFRQQL